MASVIKGIEAYGFTADVNMIEAAVKQMKDRAMTEIEEAFTVEHKTTIDVPDDDDTADDGEDETESE